MPTNTLITTQLVSNHALAEFANNCPFLVTGARTYQNDFTKSGYMVGDTIQIRKQNNFVVGDGSQAVPQPMNEQTEPLTISHQYNAMISYTVRDLTLKIDDFNDRFIRPAVQNIISKIEQDINTAAELQLNYFVGTAGTPINSFTAVDIAGTKLAEMGVNLMDDAYLVMSLRDASALKGALLNNFTPVFNEDIVRSSAIGHLSYFDIFQSQGVHKHMAGVGPTSYASDTLTVTSAVSSGNTIVVSGATASIANYFVPGDLISIAGVTSVNKLSGVTTGQNMQFVITSATASGAAGAGNLTITVSPNIVTSGPYANVSNVIPAGAVISTVGNYNVNVAYQSSALDIVCPPLYKLQVPYSSIATDEMTGLSLSVTQSGDILSYQNYMRIDVLMGYAWHQDYAVKVLS